MGRGTGEVSRVKNRVLGRRGGLGAGGLLQELWVRQTVEVGKTWHENEYGYCVNTSVTLYELFSRTGNESLPVLCLIDSVFAFLVQYVYFTNLKSTFPQKLPMMEQDNNSKGSRKFN